MRFLGTSELPVLVGILSGMKGFDDFRAAYTRLTFGKGCCHKPGQATLKPGDLSAVAAHFSIGARKEGLGKVYSVLSRLYSTKEDISVAFSPGHEIVLLSDNARANGNQADRTKG